MSVSKKELDKAYKEYCKGNKHHVSRADWEELVTGKRPATKKAKKPEPKRTWLSIQREYLRWRKTDDYRRWQHNQFLRQGGTCYYCDTDLRGVRINVEHIIPKSKGGDNRKSNLVLACSNCNKEKYTDLVPYKEKQILKTKNKAKKGTFHLQREEYPTDLDVALELRERFKED